MRIHCIFHCTLTRGGVVKTIGAIFAMLFVVTGSAFAQSTKSGVEDWATQIQRAPHRAPSPDWYSSCTWPIIMQQMASRGHFSLNQAERIANFISTSSPQNKNCSWFNKSVLFAGYSPLKLKASDGESELEWSIAPLVVARLNKRLFVEIEPEAELPLAEEQEVKFGIEYANIQYFVTNRSIVVAGSMLTPFNTWIERLHPAWINETAQMPWSAQLIPTTTNGSALKGSVALGKSGSALMYTGYLGFESDVENVFDGTKDIYGGRAALYFSPLGTEAGFSLAKLDYKEHDTQNLFGIYLHKNNLKLPVLPGALDLSADYARNSEKGKALWLEPIWKPFGFTALVLSYQRFSPAHLEHHEEPMDEHEEEHMDIHEEESGGHHGMLPEENASSLLVGARQWFGSRFKLVSGYRFGEQNGWYAQLTVRW